MRKTMKKVLLVCLALLACALMFTACDSGNEVQTPNGTTDGTTDSHVHVYGEWINAIAPTCTEEGSKARQCDCGEWDTEKIPAAGHKKGENGWCSACNQPYGTWVVNHYIDEFQKPTDETYIANVPFIGSFSNSATTNSLLKVDFIIDANGLALALKEYGDNLVKAYSNTEYEITVLDGNGTKHYYDGVMYKGGNRVFINDRQSFVSLMLNNSTLEIHIKDDSSYPSTYLFTYIRDNFADIYNLDENAQYKMLMVRSDLGKTVYVNGKMSSYYYDTSENFDEGITVQLEKTTNGYYLYYITGNTKTYLNIVKSGQYINATFDSTAKSVFVYDSNLKTYITTVNGEKYFYGAMKQYAFTTLAPCKVADASNYFIAEFAERG